MAKNLTTLTVLFVVLAVLTWGCGTPEGPAPTATEPSSTPSADVPGVGPEPPSGGDIIIDPGGYKLDNNGSITNITYSQGATTMWIPTGFTGEVTEFAWNPGGGNPVIRILGDIELEFPSGAQIKITPGNPATWQCRLNGTASWAACATQAGTTISSLFEVHAGNSNASVNPAGGTSHVFGTGTSLKVK